MSNKNQREALGQEPGQTANEKMQLHTIEAYIIPVQVMEEVKRKLRKLTIDDGEVIMQTLQQLRPTQVQQQIPAHLMQEPPGAQ